LIVFIAFGGIDLLELQNKNAFTLIVKCFFLSDTRLYEFG
jgi:hypothetical protein